MIRYHFDLYPRDDPKDGIRLVRFTKLQRAAYEDVIGVGSGIAVIRASDPEAEFLDPRGEDYVRVVEEDTDAETETVVGGFWNDKGRFAAINARNTERLTFGGSAAMAYLVRAVMPIHSYLNIFDPPRFGHDPVDRLWRLHQHQGGGDVESLGTMLWRAVGECQAFRTSAYHHIHMPSGVGHVGTHTGDRTESAIPDLSIDFSENLDSDGNPWTLTSDSFTVAIGDDLLSVVSQLMQLGLYVTMNPDTFVLSAWDSPGNRRDRTGSAWGANVVRFQVPTDATTATGNILSESERTITSYIKRSTVWVIGSDNTYAKVTGSSDIPWEGAERSDSVESSSLEQVGEASINARDDADDSIEVKIKLGADPSNGLYRPWQEVRIEDVVTVHSGTDTWDHDEQDFPVGGLRIEQKEGGDWWAWAQLGASWRAISDRQFQHPSAAVINGLRLCAPGLDCNALADNQLTAGTAANGGVESGASIQWSGGSVSTSMKHAGTNGYSRSGDGTLVYTFDPTQVFSAGVRYVVDLWSRYANDHLSTVVTFGNGTDEESNTFTGAAGADPVGTFIETETGADGEQWARIRACWTPSADRTGVSVEVTADVNSGNWAVDDLALYTTSSTSLAGTSGEAARCDHQHHYAELIGSPTGGSSGIAVEEEGSSEGTGILTLNFTGDVDVSVSGTEATIDFDATIGGSPVVPWMLTPEYGIYHLTFRGLGANNRIIYVPCTLPAAATITGLRIHVGSSNGNVCVGLYDSAGNRVATSGTVATPAAGRQAVAFTSSYAASAGRYWMALQASSSTATFSVLDDNTNAIVATCQFQDAALPLPASTTFAGETARAPNIIGMISGGYP